MTFLVTVQDTEAGTSETAVVDDYILITAGDCALTHRAAYPNGTHVLTVANAKKVPFTVRTKFVDDEQLGPPNDIDATGECCCNGCIGEGPCDLDPRGDDHDHT